MTSQNDSSTPQTVHQASLPLTTLTQRPQKGFNHLVINIPLERTHEEPIIQ